MLRFSEPLFGVRSVVVSNVWMQNLENYEKFKHLFKEYKRYFASPGF